VYRDNEVTTTSAFVTALVNNTACVIAQPSGSGKASFFVGTIYGGPITIGFAKTSAVAGGSVTVALSGAVDGYTTLRPGAPYYARYDGGIDTAPNEAGGVSSLVVGRAISADTLYSLVSCLSCCTLAWVWRPGVWMMMCFGVIWWLQLNTDSVSTLSSIADTARVVSTMVDMIAAMPARLSVIEQAFQKSHFLNPSIPVYYYAIFSTYSQAQGQWYTNNDANFVSGLVVQAAGVCCLDLMGLLGCVCVCYRAVPWCESELLG
jgi:hypothetical protein